LLFGMPREAVVPLLALLAPGAAFVIVSTPLVSAPASHLTMRGAAQVSMLAEAAALPITTVLAAEGDLLEQLNSFQSNHAFLISIMVAIATRLIISEIRYRIEKPVMDEVGRRAATQLTPDRSQIDAGAWAKLAGCVALDLAGDASELIPFLGEFTDVAFAPAEAALLYSFFKSPLVSGIGFVEEILPFTDVVPTFCIGWCLQNLWPTTPLAKRLGIAK